MMASRMRELGPGAGRARQVVRRFRCGTAGTSLSPHVPPFGRAVLDPSESRSAAGVGCRGSNRRPATDFVEVVEELGAPSGPLTGSVIGCHGLPPVGAR